MRTAFLFALAVLTLAAVHHARGQVPHADLAARITAERAANAALMKQYNWNCRTELTKDGSVKDVRLESVTYGPDGTLQRTTINDQAAPLPRGFLRRSIAENERKDTEKYLAGLRTLLEKYTLPTAGKILDFAAAAKVTAVQDPDGSAVLQLAGTAVVSPDDTLTMSVDPATAHARSMVITSTFEGSAVTAHATFKTNRAGLTYMAFAEIEVRDKNLTIQIHNYDFESSN